MEPANSEKLVSKIQLSKIKENYVELEFHKSTGSEQFYNLLCDIEDKVFTTILEKSEEWFRVEIKENQLRKLYDRLKITPRNYRSDARYNI